MVRDHASNDWRFQHSVGLCTAVRPCISIMASSRSFGVFVILQKFFDHSVRTFSALQHIQSRLTPGRHMIVLSAERTRRPLEHTEPRDQPPGTCSPPPRPQTPLSGSTATIENVAVISSTANVFPCKTDGSIKPPTAKTPARRNQRRPVPRSNSELSPGVFAMFAVSMIQWGRSELACRLSRLCLQDTIVRREFFLSATGECQGIDIPHSPTKTR